MNIQGFLDHLRVRGYSNATANSYRVELLKFQSFLRAKKLRVNQVRPRHIEAYLRSRDQEFEAKPASTRWRLAAISSFYQFIRVMSNDYVRNPVEPIRAPRRQPPNPKPLTEEQVETLMQGLANIRDKAIIGLLLHSGLRLSELCSLDKDCIRIEHLDRTIPGKVVGIGKVIGKGNREREFLVDLPTLKLIHAYLSSRASDGISALFLSNRGRRIDKRTIQHMLRAWCSRLGLPPIHPHQLRSTFATRLNKVGVPSLEISKLLGHASLDTTLIYVQPDARRIRTEYFAAQEMLNQ